MPSVPLRHDPEVIAKVMRLAKKGSSCRQIAAKLGMSKSTVSTIARDQGHTWGAVNTRKAAKANRAYGAERRADQIMRMAAEIDGIVSRYREPTKVWSFGGRENLYNEHVLEAPDSKTLVELSRSLYSLVATMRQLHDYDNRQPSDLSDFDRFLSAMIPGADK